VGGLVDTGSRLLKFFQHAFPHERSDLSHWRKRLGEKLELLLAESLRVALRSNLNALWSAPLGPDSLRLVI
jgi:hypothetical protein